MTRYELRFSKNEGRGLYATEEIQQGAIVLNLPQVAQPQPDEYSIEAWPGIHLDCSQGHCSALQHSCFPNCAVRDGKIIAWECIGAGEQLCIDYQITESKIIAPFNCMCGHTMCRGRIE